MSGSVRDLTPGADLSPTNFLVALAEFESAFGFNPLYVILRCSIDALDAGQYIKDWFKDTGMRVILIYDRMGQKNHWTVETIHDNEAYIIRSEGA